jgi:cytochrome c oxidase assembly factor 5
MKEGRLPSECIKHHIDELPEECRSLRLAAFECKRGMVIISITKSLPYQCSDAFLPSRITLKLDMRKRFRGNSAGATAARIKQESASTQSAEPSRTTGDA